MSRFQRTLALARASWAVLKSDRSLALFPLFSAIASIVFVAALALLGWMTKSTGTPDAAGHTGYTANVATIVIGVVLYVGVAFIQTYFLASLVGSANEVLEGRPTSVGKGMSIASSRIGRLLPWAVVSAIVSSLMQALEQRAGVLGDIVASVLGAAWSVLTFLTVPIIVFEDVGPIKALKRSGTLTKQTWGENIMAQVGFGLLGLLPTLLGIGLIVGGLATGTALLAIPLAAIGVIVILVTMTVLAALGGIFRTALYRYATQGSVPGPFAGADLEHAFGPRRGARGRNR